MIWTWLMLKIYSEWWQFSWTEYSCLPSWFRAISMWFTFIWAAAWSSTWTFFFRVGFTSPVINIATHHIIAFILIIIIVNIGNCNKITKSKIPIIKTNRYATFVSMDQPCVHGTMHNECIDWIHGGRRSVDLEHWILLSNDERKMNPNEIQLNKNKLSDVWLQLVAILSNRYWIVCSVMNAA